MMSEIDVLARCTRQNWTPRQISLYNKVCLGVRFALCIVRALRLARIEHCSGTEVTRFLLPSLFWHYAFLGSLQIEARSIGKLQELNKGMENKVVQLQLKLTAQVCEENKVNDCFEREREWSKNKEENERERLRRPITSRLYMKT